MNRILVWASALVLIGFTSCGDDTPDKTEFKDGVFIVNQGAFNSGTGTLTFKERNSPTIYQDAYSMNNEGAFLGNIAQSMIEHNDKNFIAINNGGKIVVTDSDDLTLVDTISTIQQGRYFASNGDQLYLTYWGDTGSNGGICEINGSTNSIEEVVELGNGPEGILFVNDLLYVAKGGGFSRDSLVLIIDPDDNSIVKSIVVGDNPGLLVKDNDENVYVVCRGHSDFFEPANNTNGRLVKLSNQDIAWSFEIPNGSQALAIDTENQFLYFSDGTNVVKQSLNATELDTKIVKDINAYSLGFDSDEKHLYASDAKDFNSQGEVFVIGSDDIEIESFPAGIIPGYFYFK
ncbi:MAG: hypothetical protein P1U56_10280 [Saprospiraceae bacterium]|nr:hypothetical protein [Saprospiraceae bacterium]